MSVTVPADLVPQLAAGIAARYVRTLRAIDRLDALDGRSGPIASEELRDDPRAADALARELVARLLRVGSDARLAPLLRALVTEDERSVAGLAVGQGASRLALLRRADDLVDVGLADRDPEHDTLTATPLGADLVTLLEQLESATATCLAVR